MADRTAPSEPADEPTTTASAGSASEPAASGPAGTAEGSGSSTVASSEQPGSSATTTGEQPAAVDEPTATTPSTAEQPRAAATGEQPTSPRVVFVETPTPPRDRGNRVVGAALALLGTVVFALLFGLAIFVVVLASEPAEFVGAAFGAFIGGAEFWIPVLFFTLGFVLVVLLLNRAGWWLHILGSILVGLITYFGSIGVLLLIDNVVLMTQSEAATRFAAVALDPRLIIAAIVGREVAIWIGLAIAARGRRVKARNAERRAAFDRELAEKKAERERAAAEASA